MPGILRAAPILCPGPADPGPDQRQARPRQQAGVPAEDRPLQHRHVAVPIAASNYARLLPNSRPVSPPATVARVTSAGTPATRAPARRAA